MKKSYSINGNCSLNMGTALNNETDKLATSVWHTDANDALWFERDFKKGPDYRPGSVTVINFDYLDQQ